MSSCDCVNCRSFWINGRAVDLDAGRCADALARIVGKLREWIVGAEMRLELATSGFILAGGAAVAGNSFVMPDGVNRAPAMVLHCTSDGATAAPCGNLANPLVIGQVAGSATASNQATEISTQQILSQSVGTQSDSAYTGTGAGSIVSLLKGLEQSLTDGVPSVPVGGQLVSRSANLLAEQSTVIFNANASRHYLAFQAPPGTGIWVNLIGGTAAPNAVDCAYFSAGTLYESGNFVNRGSIAIYSPVAATISAWEG